jgi:hypothetical protein
VRCWEKAINVVLGLKERCRPLCKGHSLSRAILSLCTYAGLDLKSPLRNESKLFNQGQMQIYKKKDSHKTQKYIIENLLLNVVQLQFE